MTGELELSTHLAGSNATESTPILAPELAVRILAHILSAHLKLIYWDLEQIAHLVCSNAIKSNLHKIFVSTFC